MLKVMLDIIIDVDDSTLRALTQRPQILQLKYVSGKNVYNAVCYLKSAMILLQNCSGLPTHTMGLLDNMMGSVDCDKFRGFMKYVCFDHKRKTCVIKH